MGGATDADDDLVAGRVNISEAPTTIFAADTDEGTWGGEFALQVGTAGPPNVPSRNISPIINGTLSKGGVGARGVLAIGGDSAQTGAGSFPPPGAGIEARGGEFKVTSPTSGSSRSGHGPGVIGLAGKASAPPPGSVGNVGVFGRGGDAESRLTPVAGATVPLGPQFPGAGVLGRGGRSMSDNGIQLPPNAPLSVSGPGAAGVIGVAGGVALPTPPKDLGAGVFGFSKDSDGVRGLSAGGAGVAGFSTTGNAVSGVSENGAGSTGHSTSNRGGIFSSDKVAQLQLTPLEFADAADLDAFLKANGEPGDLLASRHVDAERGTRIVHLQFCLAAPDPATGAGASWAQLA